MNTPYSPTLDQAARELEAATTEVATRTGNAVAREVTRIGQKAHDWWERGASQAGDMAAAVKHEAVALGTHTQRYVREEPMKSLLWAALGGALLAGVTMWFLRRDH